MSLLTTGHAEISTRSPCWIDDQSSSKINWPFNLSFWHPFGWHGQESPPEILYRKRRETELNGWTLWSFDYRSRSRIIHDWYRELVATAAQPVFVFCSRSEGGSDPGAPGTLKEIINCTHYQFLGPDTRWQPIPSGPSGIRVPHPFPRGIGKKFASAFVVQRVYYPIEAFESPSVEWFSRTKGPWCRGVRGTKHAYPTRGEYLVRPGGSMPMRDVSAILELRPPYLAIVRT